jgi:hypothetical protein
VRAINPDLCHPADVKSHRAERRWLIAVGVGFVAYRVCVEFMAWPSAVLIGVIGLGVCFALLKPRG